VNTPIFSRFLVLLLLVAGAGPLPAADDRAAAAAKLEALQAEIERVQERLEAARGEQGKLERELRRVDRDIGRNSRELQEIEQRLARTQERLKALRATRADQLAALDEQKELLARQVRAAYAGGRQAQIKLLLNQQDPAAVGRVLAYYEYLQGARIARIDAVESTLTDLRRTEAEIGKETDALEAARKVQEQRRDALLAGKHERETVLGKLKAEIRSSDRRLGTLREDEERLKELVTKLARVLADIPSDGEMKPFNALKGKLPWPAEGSIRARFGEERGKMGAHLTWQGVLIDAPEGRKVRAISHGRVIFADWMRGFGLLAIVDHGEGYMSLYGHNQSLYASVGDWVEPGEVIGASGRSGGQDSAGVYFEIRHKGKPVNPASWCRSSVASR
jgi:septal ring factor EnvC (AmiA/AmiB activator)